MNMNKVSEIFQKPEESPAQFYERLCEAYHLYSSVLRLLKISK
jgi:hypothetical protein